MVATYPNVWLCPHRTMSTFWWQPTLLTFTKNGASTSKILKWKLFLEGHPAALLSSCCPLNVLPSHCLITPAGCCIASRCTALWSSSHCAALSLSCASWMLRCLLLHCPLVLLSCCPIVLSSSSHCAALLLSASCCVASCPTTILSSCRTALSSSLHPLTVLPSRCLISPAGCCIAFCHFLFRSVSNNSKIPMTNTTAYVTST